MSLSVKFESLGLVQREELAYAVEVAQIAHGFAMALVGSLAVVFNSLGAIGFQATVAQLVVKTHLELTGSNIIVGQLLEVRDCFVVVNAVHVAASLVAIAHGVDGIDIALVSGLGN